MYELFPGNKYRREWDLLAETYVDRELYWLCKSFSDFLCVDFIRTPPEYYNLLKKRVSEENVIEWLGQEDQFLFAAYLAKERFISVLPFIKLWYERENMDKVHDLLHIYWVNKGNFETLIERINRDDKENSGVDKLVLMCCKHFGKLWPITNVNQRIALVYEFMEEGVKFDCTESLDQFLIDYINDSYQQNVLKHFHNGFVLGKYADVRRNLLEISYEKEIAYHCVRYYGRETCEDFLQLICRNEIDELSKLSDNDKIDKLNSIAYIWTASGTSKFNNLEKGKIRQIYDERIGLPLSSREYFWLYLEEHGFSLESFEFMSFTASCANKRHKPRGLEIKSLCSMNEKEKEIELISDYEKIFAYLDFVGDNPDIDIIAIQLNCYLLAAYYAFKLGYYQFVNLIIDTCWAEVNNGTEATEAAGFMKGYCYDIIVDFVFALQDQCAVFTKLQIVYEKIQTVELTSLIAVPLLNCSSLQFLLNK
jgi:hypothetical protein